jgi:hypothetical protein
MNLNEAIENLEACSTLDELQAIWLEFWPQWKAEFGQIEIRLIIAKKDEVKLNLAREALKRNSDDIDIKAVLLTTIRSMFESAKLQDAWDELAKSHLTEYEVTDPTEALFLFALRLVQFAEEDVLLDTWERYHVWWKRKLPAPAYQIISDAFFRRHRELNLKVFKGAKYGF